jgi:hypothetical protein
MTIQPIPKAFRATYAKAASQIESTPLAESTGDVIPY